MSIPNVPKPKIPAASSTGNLLSSVAPPSALPNFITTPAPQVSSSEALIKRELTAAAQNVQPIAQAQQIPRNESAEFLQPTFSPAIPPSKGIPTEASLPASGDTSELNTPSTGESASQPSLQSAHEAAEELGDVMPGSGLFTWMKGAVSSGGLLHRVAEKAKSSVDSMITTLDPQMKEYIYSGGDIEVLVASDKDDKVVPVREAFQNVFGKATVLGFPCQSLKIAAQPVGFPAGLTAAKDRIGQLRATSSKIGNNVPIVAVENFIIEVTSERWFDLGVLVLTDPERGINLESYTQMTPVPLAVVVAAKGDTPDTYEHKESGFSTTIGSYMSANLQTHHSNWHEAASGFSRRDMIHLAAKSLAVLYKRAMAATITS